MLSTYCKLVIWKVELGYWNEKFYSCFLWLRICMEGDRKETENQNFEHVVFSRSQSVFAWGFLYGKICMRLKSQKMQTFIRYNFCSKIFQNFWWSQMSQMSKKGQKRKKKSVFWRFSQKLASNLSETRFWFWPFVVFSTNLRLLTRNFEILEIIQLKLRSLFWITNISNTALYQFRKMRYAYLQAEYQFLKNFFFIKSGHFWSSVLIKLQTLKYTRSYF
jgi:hypothetical protein